MKEYLQPVESVLFKKLVPTLFGGDKPEIPRNIIALNPKDGGLGIENPGNVAAYQFQSSKVKNQIHCETI